MYNEKLENLINAALAKGVLSDSDKELIIKTAESEGINQVEIELVLEERFADIEFMRDEISLFKADDVNSGVQEESYNDLSSIISRLRANYDAIYLTKVDSVFRTYTKTGKRGEYHDVTRFDERATNEAKKSYLLALYPKTKVETLATLIFLSSFLPSCNEVVKGVSTIEEVANKKFRSVYDEAKTKYNSDTFFMQKLEDIRNDYNGLYDRLIQEIANIDKKLKKRKVINIVISSILLLEWLFFSVWLIGIEEWDWWWGFVLCFVLNLITLLIYWRVVYGGIIDFFDYITVPDYITDSMRGIKKKQNEFRTLSEIFQKI